MTNYYLASNKDILVSEQQYVHEYSVYMIR